MRNIPKLCLWALALLLLSMCAPAGLRPPAMRWVHLIAIQTSRAIT
jgi:hypothetical protein